MVARPTDTTTLKKVENTGPEDQAFNLRIKILRAKGVSVMKVFSKKTMQALNEILPDAFELEISYS